jgi:hypothetical protein
MKTEEMGSILDSTYFLEKRVKGADGTLAQMGPFWIGSDVSRRIFNIIVSWWACKVLILHHLPEYVKMKVIREKLENEKSWSEPQGADG